MSETATQLRLVLASSSPRRRQLLAEAGYAFQAVSPLIEEPEDLAADLSPAGKAEALAYFKARTVAERMPEACVLGADTIVAVAGHVLGKPIDDADAERMLRALAGTRHAVITGVVLLGPCDARVIASDTTYVTMLHITDADIVAYVASGEWRGKAGAYAIQETADRFVVKVEGSFSNVVGLPIELVDRMLREAGLQPAAGDGTWEPS